MARIPIRSMMGQKGIPPRFCDLVIEDGETMLVKKTGNRYQQIRWDDLKRQVEEAVSVMKE